jgi:peroxiredoxin
MALGPEWIGKIAPDFTLKTIDDRAAFSLNDLRGQVVVIDFWATWCPPCRRALTQLAALDAKHSKLTVLAVNVDNERRNAAEFLKRNRIQTAALFDEKKEVIEEYGVSAMPSAFVIDKRGVVRFIHSGYTDSEVEQIKNEVKGLL